MNQLCLRPIRFNIGTELGTLLDWLTDSTRPIKFNKN
nr:MAG TPA: hypothetical protein [Caudoviricetes sp.]